MQALSLKLWLYLDEALAIGRVGIYIQLYICCALVVLWNGDWYLWVNFNQLLRQYTHHNSQCGKDDIGGRHVCW